MKKLSLIGCMLMAIIAAGELRAEQQTRRIINLLNIHEETMVVDFAEGRMSEYILECPEGALLPFKMHLKGEFLALESGAVADAQIKILKTCYVRCVAKEQFLFSADLQQWKGFSEFFTGKLGLSFHVNEGHPVVGLEHELYQKKP